MGRGDISILACESGKPFANKVYDHLENMIRESKVNTRIEKVSLDEKHFANTEVKTVIEDSVRGKDVYIFQDVDNSVTPYSVDTNFRAIKTAIDATWRSDSKYVTAILPSFPYARQDKALKREGITASVIAQELENVNTTRVISLDVHNNSMAGFFRKTKFENLHASKNIINYIIDNIGLENLVISSADAGGASRAEHYSNKLKLPLNIAYKKKDYNKTDDTKVEEIVILGYVKNKRVFIIDDMIDTSSTTRKVVESMKKNEATDIYFGCSLPLFNDKAIERLTQLYNECLLKSVIGTDAVYHGGEEFIKNNPWYKEISVAKYFAKVIFNINQGESITKLLE